MDIVTVAISSPFVTSTTYRIVGRSDELLERGMCHGHDILVRYMQDALTSYLVTGSQSQG